MQIKIHKILFISILCITLISLSSCEKYDLLKGSGKTIVIERQLLDFGSIEVNDLFEISLMKDSSNKVIISGGENLLDKIKTDINNNSLIISDNNTCGWTRSYEDKIQIEIHYKTLNHLILNGEATVKCKNTIEMSNLAIDVHSGIAILDLNLNCESMNFNVHGGTGNYFLSGKIGYCYTYINGNGYLFADSLKTDFMYINNSSTGDLHINVIKELEYTIKNRGNIYYTGDPYKITIVEGFGKGKLIREN